MTRSSSQNLSTGTLPLQDSAQDQSTSPAVETTNRNPNRPDRRVSSINNLAAIAAANRSATRLSRSSSRNSVGTARALEGSRNASSSSVARDNSASLINLSFADALTAVRDEFGGDDGGGEEFDYVDTHTRAFTTAIHNAGTNAFGINAIDVWLLDEDDGSFHHAQGGWWRHYAYKGANANEQRALARIEDVTRNDFVPPLPQIPGAGLAGYFWGLLGTNNHHCVWRDVKAITSDPDQPPYLRMQMLEQAGFGKAAGVPFDIRGHRGIVIYLTRETASEEQLTEKANDAHLRVSADLIGCISANSITQEASIGVKQTRTAHTLRRVKAKFQVAYAFSTLFKNYEDGDDDVEAQRIPDITKKKSSKSFRRSISNGFRKRTKNLRKSVSASYREGLGRQIVNGVKHKTQVTAKKCKGGGLQPPPAMPWWQVWWVFLGSFTTLAILTAISRAISLKTGYAIILGPFGALMTLQYGLTPAPASQPRNAFYGQTIAISIALLVKLATATIFHEWIRIPVATALAIATMTRLGITHPPAGASAAIFASNESFDVINMALMLLGNTIAVFTATLINNLNDTKQYPVYWRLFPESWSNLTMALLEEHVPYYRNKKMEREEEVREGQRKMKASLRMSIVEINRQKSMRF